MKMILMKIILIMKEEKMKMKESINENNNDIMNNMTMKW